MSHIYIFIFRFSRWPITVAQKKTHVDFAKLSPLFNSNMYTYGIIFINECFNPQSYYILFGTVAKLYPHITLYNITQHTPYTYRNSI